MNKTPTFNDIVPLVLADCTFGCVLCDRGSMPFYVGGYLAHNLGGKIIYCMQDTHMSNSTVH